MSNEAVDSAPEEVTEEVTEVLEETTDLEIVDDSPDIVDSPEVEAETTEEFQEEVAEAIEDGASEEEVKSMVRKFQLKVNGKTIEREIDLSDEDAVRQELQKSAAFNHTAQEAAKLKKTYENEIARLQSNPWEVLKELGLDPEDLNERFIEDRIEEMKKTPDQLEKEKMEIELSQARKRLQEIEKTQQDKEEQEKIAEAGAQLEEEIITELKDNSTLPPTQKTMARIADALLHAMDYAEENGYDASGITVADIIPEVEKEIRAEMRSFLDNAPETMMEEVIGKKNIERLRKSRVDSIKNNPKQTIKETAKVSKTEDSSKEKLRSSDFFRNLGR